MFPAALVVGLWLWCSTSRKATMLWGAAILLAYACVAVSKILYKGWGVGLGSIDIAVFSGHAMNACLVSTVALSVLSSQLDVRLRWPAAILGLLMTWCFSVYFVAPYVHPLPEAIAGALIGSIAACVFLYKLQALELNPIPASSIVFGLLVVALCASLPKYTAESLLNRVAVTMSGASQAFKTPHQLAATQFTRY